jgi:hypothetical protein
MIPQLNIITDTKKIISGYNNVLVKNLNQITNGYVNTIICNCIDQLSSKERNNIFLEMLKKLNHDGQITIKFINPILIAHKVNNGFVDGMGFADMVSGINSCWTESDIFAILANLEGFRINKLYSEDIHSIIVIQKI